MHEQVFLDLSRHFRVVAKQSICLCGRADGDVSYDFMPQCKESCSKKEDSITPLRPYLFISMKSTSSP